MLDAALAGDAPTALVELDRLLIGGENPIGLLGQIGSTLRRLAAATRLVEEAEQAGRRASLRAALEEVGVRPFVVAKSESQLRQLGRQRAGKLCQWLLDADLALKGDSQLPARTVLEQLVVRMARQPQGAK
jgi:DNA polymerase-3 subunit delta